jgi:dihydroorotate dehydrogenase electron transfer subunit
LIQGTVLLWLAAPSVAAAATPGQFAQVAVPSVGGWDPFLRRPISLALIDKAGGRVGLIVRVLGRGTAAISAVPAGGRLDLIAPLGRGFMRPAAGRSLLVGGGIGAAPLFALGQSIAAGANPTAAQTRVLMLLGARAARELWARELAAELGLPALIATDDGSAGHPGMVTDLLRAELAAGNIASVAACGPRPMLATVQQLARNYGVPCYLSLEQHMACGVGACRGCAWPRSGGNGYAHVCRDGPVFAATEVAL